jgi:hypothetical protein
MKSFITLILIAVMAAVLYWQYRMNIIALERHRHLVQDQSVVQGLEKQQQCTERVFAVFRHRGLQFQDAAAWKAHYNASLGKCYAQIETNALTLDITWHGVSVFDVATNIEVAGYSSRTSPGQDESEVMPFTCDVTLPPDTHTECTSRVEFMERIKAYMQ